MSTWRLMANTFKVTFALGVIAVVVYVLSTP